MMYLASIVEGDGEVLSLPILARRLNEWHPSQRYVEALTPIKVKRDRFLNREDEFRKYVLLATSKCGVDGWLLVLLDADDDCPASLGANVMRRINEITTHPRVSVVIANREYEAWFIASAASLCGRRGFALRGNVPTEAERPRNAKGWIASQMSGRGYGETTDQPAFTSLFDIQQAFNGSRSFRKLCKEWQQQTA